MKILFLCLLACNGPSASVSCGEGTTLTDGVCVANDNTGGGAVVCGAGTVLVNGSCVVGTMPAPVTCAAGTTFDMGSNSCTADIARCGDATHAVNGECVPLVRISIANFFAVPGDLNFYAVDLAHYSDPQWSTHAILLGHAAQNATSAMTGVPLALDHEYIFLFSDATQPLTNANLHDVPLGYARILSDRAQISDPADLHYGYLNPILGDQLIFLADAVYQIAVPSDPVPANETRVSLAPTVPGDHGYYLGSYPADGTIDDLDTYGVVSNLGRSREFAWDTTSRLTLIETFVDTYGLYMAATLMAPTSDPRLVAGQRYLCVISDLALCFDGNAHADLASLPRLLPALGNPVRYSLINAARRNVNVAIGDTEVTLEGQLPSTNLQVGLPSGAKVAFSYGYTSRDATTVVTGGGQDAFMLFVDDGAGVDLAPVPDRGLVLAGDITYTMVNGHTGPIAITFDDNIAGDGAYPPTGALTPGTSMRFDHVVAQCPASAHAAFTINGACYDLDICSAFTQSIEGEHVVVVYQAGKLTIFRDDGTSVTLDTVPC